MNIKRSKKINQYINKSYINGSIIIVFAYYSICRMILYFIAQIIDQNHQANRNQFHRPA